MQRLMSCPNARITHLLFLNKKPGRKRAGLFKRFLLSPHLSAFLRKRYFKACDSGQAYNHILSENSV